MSNGSRRFGGDDRQAGNDNCTVGRVVVSTASNQAAATYPDSAALRCDGATTTYSSLALDVARFADYLIDGGLTR